MLVHITEQALRQVQLNGKKAVKLTDAELAGFGAQLTAAGKGSYFVRLRDAQGRVRQHKLGAIGQLAAHQAREQARALIEQVRQSSRAPTRRAGARQAGLTLSAFFWGDFMRSLRAQGRRVQTHASVYRNHIEPVLGARLMASITAQDVLRLHEHLKAKEVAGGRWSTQQGRKLSAGTRSRVLVLLRHLFNEARRLGVPALGDNPAAAVRLPTGQPEVKAARFSQEDEVRRLLGAARELDAHFADALLMAVYTGLRRGNVYRLRWAQVDFKRGLLRLQAEEVKQKKEFIKHLSEPVLAMLQRRWQAQSQAGIHSPWVFANPKTGQPYHSRRSLWLTVCRRAGLQGLRFHDLRHSFASLLLKSGRVNLVQLKEALGHSQLKTTLKYAHLSDEQRRQVEQTLVQMLGEPGC